MSLPSGCRSIRRCTRSAHQLARRSNRVGPAARHDQQRHVAIDLGQVGEEVQALVVGPVQVFELQHDRCPVGGTDAAEQLRRGVEGAIADLPGVVEDALEVAALAPLDADQVAEQMGMAFGELGAVVVDEQRRDALLHLAARRLDAVVVADLEAPGQDVAQQSERLALRLRRGAAAEDEEAFRTRIAPGRELVEQTALADAGIGHHADRGETAIDEQPLEGVLQRLEFGVAADHPGRDAFDAAAAEAKAARLRAQHEVALDRLVDALDRERLLRSTSNRPRTWA